MEKLFAISYKLRYFETSDWGAEYIRAKSRSEALNRFAKLRKIRANKFKKITEWHWEEGVWLAQFSNIKVIKEIPCPHCSGKGIIYS
ncbi:MAG: hypothetical protein AB1432_07480 [Bacteroidota bacterium]|jgi:predicted methyltransferase